MHSSQNEQDSRNYAKFAKVPMLEPSDSEEARQFAATALEMSETFDTPVIVRFVTRISHSSSVVDVDPAAVPPPAKEHKPYKREIGKFVMVPGNARRRHPVVEERIRKLREYAESTPLNRIEPGNDRLGIVASGVVYQHAREVFPDATFLRLGMVYPLPEKLIREFAGRVKKVLVIEELDPFFEEHIRLLGIQVAGKDVFPIVGEFSPTLIRQAAVKAGILPAEVSGSSPAPALDIPVRPPTLCPGCGHRGMFTVLKEAGVVVMGDIGCYTLGAASPLEALHFCGCMGASIGVAHGMDKGGVPDRHVAVIGDSTLFHSGLHPLINTLYNQGKTTTIIADNGTTGMTGHQHHPGTGQTLQKQPTVKVDLERMVRALGFGKVDVCDPNEMDDFRKILEDHLKSDEASVIIARRPCALQSREKRTPPRIDPELCTNCGTCLDIGCSPLVQQEDCVSINEAMCTGCGLCVQVCPAEAIGQEAK
jgi:indolepyruvate ferredoxin oxidoreductase alpha subunit